MSLRVEGLSKTFGEKTLFQNLNFEAAGPAVLWAPSGWGKTTLLRILMGLETPDAGYVTGVGRVGAVFQEDRLCPQLTAPENVALVLPEGRAAGPALAADFARLGMGPDTLNLPAGRLSGGQTGGGARGRPRGAEAETLLLDDPFPGLDPAAREEAAALLREKCAGRPTLLATHDQQAIQALGWPVLELAKLCD